MSQKTLFICSSFCLTFTSSLYPWFDYYYLIYYNNILTSSS